MQIFNKKQNKNGGKRKLYVSLSRSNNNNKQSFKRSSNNNNNQTNATTNVVSFQIVDKSTTGIGNRNSNGGEYDILQKDKILEKIIEQSFEGSKENDNEKEKVVEGVEEAEDKNDVKKLNVTMTTIIKEKDCQAIRSRGSSNSSQITLTTSYGKMDDDGNVLNTDTTTTTTTMRKNMEEVDDNNKQRKNGKSGCCKNCGEKKKKGCGGGGSGGGGFSSLTNRCIFKTKTQSATLETIAKKIKLLPNGKFTKSSSATTTEKRKNSNNNKSGVNRHQNKKLTKTLSSYTISNSSLQDLDESEFTSSELAEIMGQMKYGQEIQV